MGHAIQVQFNHIWNEFAASKLWKWFSLSSLMCRVVRLWVLENCKGCVGGGANLRGLIMTPYYSLQELPSFAHHITCMAWHGKRRCMSFLTQLGTYWLQGKLDSLATIPDSFGSKEYLTQKKKGKRSESLICFFFLSLVFLDWNKQHNLTSFLSSIRTQCWILKADSVKPAFSYCRCKKWMKCTVAWLD